MAIRIACARFGLLRFGFENNCKCIFLSKFHSRLCSVNIFSDINGQEIFEKRRLLNKRVYQVANYYVKKKEKNTGPSATIWAALSGITCGLIISAVAYVGMHVACFLCFRIITAASMKRISFIRYYLKICILGVTHISIFQKLSLFRR